MMVASRVPIGTRLAEGLLRFIGVLVGVFGRERRTDGPP